MAKMLGGGKEVLTIVVDENKRRWAGAWRSTSGTSIGHVRALLHGLLMADADPPTACSALHFAAALGQVDATKMLVEAGADVNLQDKDGEASRPTTRLLPFCLPSCRCLTWPYD